MVFKNFNLCRPILVEKLKSNIYLVYTTYLSNKVATLCRTVNVEQLKENIQFLP